MQCDMRLLNLVVMLSLRWKPHCSVHELCEYSVKKHLIKLQKKRVHELCEYKRWPAAVAVLARI